MDPPSPEIAAQYLSLQGQSAVVKELLGWGTDGHVWKSSNETAVKVFHNKIPFYNERDSYLRLAEWGFVNRIDGFWVPRMLGFDENLWVVEMDVIQDTPYIIDFGKVRIDRPPDFDEDVLRSEEEKGQFRFEHHWPTVKKLLATLESIQIYYLDPQRGNIGFPDMP